MKCSFLIRALSISQNIFSLLQKEKNKEQEEEEEEEDIGEDSQFMKLAKKVTAKSLQKRGGLIFFFLFLLK